jgi:catechol 2,3-dioxygenase-like lactoylglutathione lyase family enzyme
MQNIAATELRFNQSMVTIIVRDMDRSLDFYTGHLGLQLRSRYGNEFAIVDAPGVTIALHPESGGRRSTAGDLSIGLGVDSVDAGMKALAKRGIEFVEDVVVDSPMRFAFFKDPDGVELYLAEQSEWQ